MGVLLDLGGPDSTRLSDHLRVLRRRWPLILLTALVAPLAAFYFSGKQERLYTASTVMLVSNQNLPSSVVAGQSDLLRPTRFEDLDTLARVAEVPTVAKQTLRVVGETNLTPAQLLAETSVSADPSSDILTFSVTDRQPDRAVRLANQYAVQFMAYRTGLQSAVIDNALKPLDLRIRNLQRILRVAPPATNHPMPVSSFGCFYRTGKICRIYARCKATIS